MARAAAAESHSDTREEIIHAALQAFAERGFDGATTRDIANRAGVNQGLIPYYFGSKLKLWRDAVDRAFGQLARGIESVRADPSVTSDRERTALLLRGYVRFVAQNPEFVRIMHEEGKHRGPRMRWLVDRHVKPLWDGVSELLLRSEGSGLLGENIAPVHLYYILAGAVGVIFHQAEECKRLTGIDPFDEKVIEEHARAVEILFLGPTPSGTSIDSNQEKTQ